MRDPPAISAYLDAPLKTAFARRQCAASHEVLSGCWSIDGRETSKGSMSKCYYAIALVVLTTTSTEIARITLFCDPGLFARFGASATQPDHSNARG